MIELVNVKKSFGDRNVLNDINLNVKKGEIITIMGKSGAGKSTLLNILGFFDSATCGDYIFEGKKITGNYEKMYIRNEKMGFVFQSYNLITKLSVYENIVLPICYSVHRKSNGKQWLQRVSELMDKFNIRHIENSNVEHISGGEKQRVCLARAMVCQPEIIISDEPTGNLDEYNAQLVLNGFKEINREGKTVVIVTHDERVEKIAKTRYFLEGGILKKYEI